MTAPRSATLYSPQMLALAVELAGHPYDPAALFRGEARSRSCGSTLAFSSSGRDGPVGLRVTACAVGQASAAIFARHALPLEQEALGETLAALEAWLSGEGPMPDWPDLEMIAAAREFPGRHGAILLPWKAALDALSKGEGAR